MNAFITKLELSKSVINFREVMTCRRQAARRRPVDRLLMAMARRERCPVTVFPAGGEIAARNESERVSGEREAGETSLHCSEN